MELSPLTLPKNVADFQNGDHDMQRIEDLLNALQKLQVRITRNGTTQVVTTYMQISGNTAVIEINL